MTNAAGAAQATLTLSAFGQALASTGSSTDPYQYAATSRYRSDGDAGLALVGCRYYDAQVGAFISRDTVLTEKPYTYCDGDPVNATDPSGHWSGWPPSWPTIWPPTFVIPTSVRKFGNTLAGISVLFHNWKEREEDTFDKVIVRIEEPVDTRGPRGGGVEYPGGEYPGGPDHGGIVDPTGPSEGVPEEGGGGD